MFISKLLSVSTLFLSVFALITHSESLTTNSAAFIPISGNTMAAAEIPSGDSRIYYQDSTNNSIIELVVSNAFNVGQLEQSGVLVPPSEVRSNSPIAAALVTSVSDPWQELHVFFFSPENVLSEYYIKTAPNAVWHGGPNCNDCLTNEGFVGLAGNQMLYAMGSSATSPPTLRVGFASTGAPNTISEAVNNGDGWSVASLI
ncbi:hypothetical protein GYMLUDRAFT_96807 [Collybiopsis luxurians FD-317 M1]|uniref:Fucose-specific lectin n=1 Tax=Collybiopsis luxurians FD-317 M1 TaxID=944289 RepID=A0A0D0BBG4_9AGAR|nr:hypothetical protein GYMLUDRAFT_96807 [Collybiopsis luxurians FD-317 M1]